MLKTILTISVLACVTIASADYFGHSEFYELTRKQASRVKGDPIDTSAFLDALPIPSTIKVGANTKQITMTLGQVKAKFYKNLPTVQAWGYNGSSPGPTIEVESGKALQVLWKNSLPTTHLLPADNSPMPGMSGGSGNLPAVRAVTHLHGGAVPGSNLNDRLHNNDGWPENWTVPGETQISDYPNLQSARTLWYHDHAMGSTARNVSAGLAGLYLIRDAYERSLNLPSGKFEVPLILQTHDFDDNGKLIYPSKITAEVYGSSISVNGKVWPYLNVEPRKYRFRFVNGSTARTIAMKLLNTKDGSSGPEFYQIGSDAGFLSKTVVLNQPKDPNAARLSLTPAERADVIIDFSKYAGQSFLLENNNTGDTGDAELYLPQVMLFKVGTALSGGPDTSHIPTTMNPISKMRKASNVRKIVLGLTQIDGQAPVMLLNNKVWDDHVEETIKLNSTEVWELTNTLPDNHPFHLHLVQFQVLDRRPFDVDHFNATKEIVYTGPAVAPDENEQGWKDTVRASPKSVTRIITKFGPYPGKFLYHCHILEHEDMGMMRPFEIVP